jgi:quercetin dioxygenase-like cupin family protein
MRSLTAKFLSVGLMTAGCLMVHPVKAALGQSADAGQNITIARSNAIPSATGAADRFTGSVKLDMMAVPAGPSRARVQSVTFAAGGYTAWHSHPLGQVSVVTEGSGYIQQWGGQVQQIHPGDVIWTPPNVKHWHGAGPKAPMTHISVYDEPEGQVTKWMEKLTDAEYRKATAK